LFAGFEGDFSDLNGDEVKVFDMSLSPAIYGMHFCSKWYRDTNKIDRVAVELVHRYATQENVKDIKTMLDAGYAIADKYRKEEVDSMIKMIKAQSEGGKK